jgi:Fe-S-cluster containining protein
MGANDDYLRLLRDVDALFDEAFQAHRSEMECKRGCSQCCVDPSVAQVEVDRLALDIPALPAERRAALRELVTAAIPADGTPPAKCLALGPDGACQIYELRPVVCRYWGMMKLYPKGTSGLRLPMMYSRSCWLNYNDRPMRKTEGDDLISFDVEQWDARMPERERNIPLSSVLPKLLADD